MSAAQIASNDELAMIVLPQSIIMSPSMPKLYKRQTDAHLVHVPTAMPTCIHHAFGKGNKRSLYQHKNDIVYQSFYEIIGGSDTYVSAYEETQIRKNRGGHRAVDMHFQVLNVPDDDLDDLANMMSCSCGHANWDFLTLIDPFKRCGRCRQRICVSERMQTFLVDADKVRRDVLPVLRRNGMIPMTGMVTTVRLPLAPECIALSISDKEFDSILEVLAETAPNYVQRCGQKTVIQEQAKKLKYGLSRSFPLTVPPMPRDQT